MLIVAIIVLGLAILPAAMLAANRQQFRLAPRPAVGLPGVSLIIPARNEQASIVQSVEAALQNNGVELEVIVMDDHSTDETAALVRGLANEDPRVRLETAPDLPEGWCGKQHACFAGARLARYDLLAWIDADVQLSPDALSRMVGFHRQSGAPLISGFPAQVTLTWMEKLVVPLIHLVLLCYLPLSRMRASTDPRFAAACGQLVMAERATYEAVGGHSHELVRNSLHDGVTLPRAFRTTGHKTDIFDASDVATCRMYRTADQVWQGFAKNATEGLATPVGIWVWSVLLLGGHVLPFVLFLAAWAFGASLTAWGAILLACGFAAYTSIICGVWFSQRDLSIILRPVGVSVLVAIQWYAWIRKLRGKSAGWRGRAYTPASAAKTS